MVNYQEGKIYKIMNDETDEIYIGSTCSSLAKRFGGHKTGYNAYKNNKTNYVTSFKILDYPSSKIILIELCPCNSKEELAAREAYYIKLLPCVNKQIPLQTDEEYRDKNKDKHKLYVKNHYEKNKEVYLKKAIKQRENQDDEEIKKYKHEWYEKNKEDRRIKSKIYYEKNKEYIILKTKKFYEEHKEDRILKSKKYYEEHKEEINQKRRDNKINKSNI